MRLLLYVLMAATSALGAASADYDVVLRNGLVVDGTGRPATNADVAFKDGRIAAFGIVAGTAKREIDVSNLIVAPGFIDVHTHAEDIVDLPRAENFARMGVTTVVMGNCGSSVTNVAKLFERCSRKKISVNVATLIGHGDAREQAMGGRFDREPTPAELAAMKSMVDQAMKDGALGLSTGLIYLPGTFAKTDELIELARVAAAHGGIYASHMRSESGQIFGALDEVFRIGREAGIRCHISHIKLAGRANWGQADKVIAAIEKARADGLDITQDQYGYTASSTSIATLVPKKYREGGKFSQFYTNAASREAMIEEMTPIAERGGSADYSYAVIAEYKKDKSLNGLNIAEASRKLRGSDSLRDQIETILQIQKNGSASAVFHGIGEADVIRFMQHSNTMFASDSGVRRYKEGAPHPRGYGNNARILSRYVRDQHVVPLEEAVRKMTSLPAATFRIEGRGLIRAGYWADVVVFDPGRVEDNASYNDPHHYATGFERVFVNGETVVKRDVHTGERPGRPVALKR